MTTTDDTQPPLTALAALADAADDALHRLALLTQLSAAVDAAAEEAVAEARAQGGSWRAVGEALGVSRQAACKRYSRAPVREPEPGTARERTAAVRAHGTDDELHVLTLWPGAGIPLAKIATRPATASSTSTMLMRLLPGHRRTPR